MGLSASAELLVTRAAPRDATRKRGTCYGNVAGWLAGWLDVTRRYCINTVKPVLKLFRPSGTSPIILVSLTLRRYSIPRGTPSAG